jgi:hypothetical protein
MNNRKAGLIHLSIDGVGYTFKGGFKYGLGVPRRETFYNSSGGVEGFKEFMESAPFVEGEVFDQPDLDIAMLLKVSDATVTLQLANDKVVVFKNAWYAGTGEGNSDEGTFNFKMVARTATEIR